MLIENILEEDKLIDPLTEALGKEFEEEMDANEMQRENSYIKDINGSDNSEKELDKLLTEEELLRKLNELKRLKEEDSDEEYGQMLTGEKSE